MANWKKGFFRIWLVLSCLWIGGFVLYFINYNKLQKDVAYVLSAETEYSMVQSLANPSSTEISKLKNNDNYTEVEISNSELTVVFSNNTSDSDIEKILQKEFISSNSVSFLFVIFLLKKYCLFINERF